MALIISADMRRIAIFVLTDLCSAQNWIANVTIPISTKIVFLRSLAALLHLASGVVTFFKRAGIVVAVSGSSRIVPR
jgi:succinate dehydrogenase/fumarate reductase cytochrome b subunit